MSKTVQEQLDDISASLVGIAFTLAQIQSSTPVSHVDAPSPVAAPAIPRRVYAYLANGLLAEGVVNEPTSGARIDPVVDADCPSAVAVQDPLDASSTLYVSKPRPDLKEMWIGYCIRVSKQCKGTLGRISSAGYHASAVFEKAGGTSSDLSLWPKAAAIFHRPPVADGSGVWISTGQPSAAVPVATAPDAPVEVAVS